MPDDHNVPVGGSGQTCSARVTFASDTVREKVDDLLAEAGGSLVPVDEVERQRIAMRLRKARAAAPLNLLPLLTLLLAACGKVAPDLSGVGDPGSDVDEVSADAGSQDSAAEQDSVAETPSLPEGGWRLVQASTPAGRPPMSPEAEANMVRLCLKAITDNTLQPSAIHEICSLIDLDAVDQSHDVIWRWHAPPRPEGYSTHNVCYLVNAQDLLFWMFMESPPSARGYAGRPRPKTEPEIPGTEDGITDASLVTVVAAVPEAAAAAAGGFGGGLAALPLTPARRARPEHRPAPGANLAPAARRGPAGPRCRACFASSQPTRRRTRPPTIWA